MIITFSGRDYPGIPTTKTETVGNPDDRNVYAQAALVRLYTCEVDEAHEIEQEGYAKPLGLYRQGARWFVSAGPRGTGIPNGEIQERWAFALLEGRAVPVARTGEGGIEALLLRIGGGYVGDWQVRRQSMSVWS